MNNPKTFLKFITKRSAKSLKANIDLTIGFTVENVKLTGDQTRVFEVVHMLSGTVDILWLDVSASDLDQIISIDAHDSQVKLSDLHLTDISDLNAYFYK